MTNTQKTVAFLSALQACTFDVRNVPLVLEMIQDPEVDVAVCDNIAIRSAHTLKHPEIVAALLERPEVDPSARDWEALERAQEKGYSGSVRLLAMSRARLWDDSREPLSKGWPGTYWLKQI